MLLNHFGLQGGSVSACWYGIHCLVAVTAWIHLRAHSPVRESILESSPLIALECAAGCINCSGLWCICPAERFPLSLALMNLKVSSRDISWFAWPSIEVNIVVSESNNEGISDHSVTVRKLGAALAVNTCLTFEVGGESPC